MSTNPYLLLVVGLESKENDPRFSEDARRMNLAAHGNHYLGEMLVPPLCRESASGFWEEVDLVTGQEVGKRERPEFGDVFYEGNPALKDAWKEDGHPVGYVVEQCRGDYLLRCVSILTPAIEKRLGEGRYFTVPTMVPEEHFFRYRHETGGLRIDQEPEPGDKWRQLKKGRLDKAIAEGRWIQMLSPAMTDFWFSIALHLLHLAGWVGATRDDLKVMVVFDWA